MEFSFNHKDEVRNNWTIEEITEVYHTPLMQLIDYAGDIHKKYHERGEIQVCALLSIKTGGCAENCSYCAQSVINDAEIEVEPLLPLETVVEAAKEAKADGATRFCMGAAWRNVRDNKDFDKVLKMISAVNDLGMEVCSTLGMATEEQAKKMKAAGLTSYNHNLDTSEAYYKEIITTRKYGDRLQTLENIRKSGLSICSGGIIGMGESEDDRISMLHSLATLEQQPESVPINTLVKLNGTRIGEQKPVETWDIVRMIATARILMPKSMVRLSAGRESMSYEAQALCFLAGANSIFSGDKLLTTRNVGKSKDSILFDILGLKPRKSHQETLQEVEN